MFKNFPVILLNNFMRPSAEEKTALINQIIEPKIKLNNNRGGAVSTQVEYESNSFLDKIYAKYRYKKLYIKNEAVNEENQ